MQSSALLTEDTMDVIANEYSELKTLSAANDAGSDVDQNDGYVGTYQISYQISYMIS